MPTLDFNNLPHECLHLVLRCFKPKEMTLISPTCKQWHETIVRTKSFWRIVLAEKDATMEDIKRIIQLSNERSGNSIVRINIRRRIETTEELEEIFSWIQPSSNSVECLIICIQSDLSDYSRQLSQSFPRLRLLWNCNRPHPVDPFYWNIKGRKLSVLPAVFSTVHIGEIQEQDLKWISRFDRLEVNAMNFYHSLWSVLSSSSKNLRSFTLNQMLGETHGFIYLEPISMGSLETLSLPTDQDPQVVPILSLMAPNLKVLSCTFSQFQHIKACSLQDLNLTLEDEDEEEWEEWQDEEFISQLQAGFHDKRNLKALSISGQTSTSQYQDRLFHLLEAFRRSNDEGESFLCPNLEELTIFEAGKIDDFESLARLFLKRNKYAPKNRELNAFEVHLLDLDDFELLDQKELEFKEAKDFWKKFEL